MNWLGHVLHGKPTFEIRLLLCTKNKCPHLHNEYRCGLNGGRIWYKEWFGLLAMALKRPASAVPANCSTVQTRLASCHRCALRNKPFIRPVEHAIDQLSMPLWAQTALCNWSILAATLFCTILRMVRYENSVGTIVSEWVCSFLLMALKKVTELLPLWSIETTPNVFDYLMQQAFSELNYMPFCLR